jgi:hypothetical protein
MFVIPSGIGASATGGAGVILGNGGNLTNNSTVEPFSRSGLKLYSSTKTFILLGEE